MAKDLQLQALREAASDAYARVRLRVIDQLPAPAKIDIACLDDAQRQALLDLERAETELALYREKMYAYS